MDVLNYGVYRVLTKNGGHSFKTIESRHVTFAEELFPGAPDLINCMDEEVSNDGNWEEQSSSDDSSDDDNSDDVSQPSKSDNDELDETKYNKDEDDDVDDIQGQHNKEHAQENIPAKEIPVSNTQARSRYPQRVRKPPSNWLMAASSTSLNITTGDDPTLREAL